ncbi:MAG: sensor domain-containing protein [Bifidobacteriaceae bacterium]|jgi:signal transduction histidine kinase|nr:sensor domain-containing protein [Bifidobacteriaceae bacterium]
MNPNLTSRAARDLGRDTCYLLLALPYGVVAFAAVMTGLALGAGLASLGVGVPLLAATLKTAQGLAALDVARLKAAGRDPHLPPAPRPPPPPSAGVPAWTRLLLAPLRDPQRWREALHALLALPIGLFTWSVTVILGLLAVTGLTAIVWEPITDRYATFNPGADQIGLAEVLRLPLPNWAIYTAIGLVAAALLTPVLRGLTTIHSAEARLVLAPSDKELARRAAELEQARAQAAADAESRSLRKLERDIHDGPQQRLVRLNLDLAAAQRRLETGDGAAAGALLAEARAATSQTIAELRALSRGIAPPILQDRGLGAALSAVAAGAGLPVYVSIEPEDAPRLPEAVEAAFYFAASELLANVAKHARATSAEVSLQVSPSAGSVELRVHDDGRGGAAFVAGHGLAGLRDRLAGVDGTVWLSQGIAGRGTVVLVTAPLTATGSGRRREEDDADSPGGGLGAAAGGAQPAPV